MNDIEYELKKEQREKKVISYGDKHRKRKTKKCTFVYEGMSKEERKKYMANGEVKTFQLRPMQLKEYDRQTGDKKRELLMFYGEKYGWNPAGVAAALNCDYKTARCRLEEYMLTQTFKARMKATSDEKKREQIEARKSIANAPVQASEGENIITPQEPQNATQSVTEPVNGGYSVTLNSVKSGERLMRQLSGIASSLEPDREYIVAVLICEAGQKPRQELVPCHDQ